MKKLEVRLTLASDREWEVGTLAENRGQVYFEFAESFLATGWELSPFHLSLAPGLIHHHDHEFGPLPGLFDDSLPDGWGLLLMDRHFREVGALSPEVSPLDRLAWLGNRTMGALTYHPPSEPSPFPETAFELAELARESAAILDGSPRDILPALLRAGGSPGGARPKVLVGYDSQEDLLVSGTEDLPPAFQHWIVKFFGRDDTTEAGAVEYAYSLMAQAAGLEIPPTRLFLTDTGDRFFGVRRFDRATENRRLHVHTFGNLIQSYFRVPSADYSDLMKTTRLLTSNHQDVLRAFRQMIFNVLTHNRDDHVKNFAFIFDDESAQWSLAPAYDLVYSAGPGGQHTMTVAGEGLRPSADHFGEIARGAGINTRDLARILDEVRAVVADWYDYAEQAGVTESMTAAIAAKLPPLD
jgi:serine/threonine-protein kinase HipA